MDAETSVAMHGEPNIIQPNPRGLTIEDAVMNQIDRIGFLRSLGKDWKEPLFHLRDILIGLEDNEFFNGIPMNLQDKQDKIKAEHLETYRARSWDAIPVRMRSAKDEAGNIEEWLDPTPIELSKMLQILMALLARRNMTWRRKNVDEINMTFGKEIQDDAPNV